MQHGDHSAWMHNGTPYEIRPCLDPELHITPQLLKEQIRQALQCLSAESRWQRFASPVHELSDEQLDYLTDLDGSDRVAWCAAMIHEGKVTGIGLARYIRCRDDPAIAEFAVTIIDAYQGQGIGTALLGRLLQTASANGLHVLRGYVNPGNKRMLALGQRYGGKTTRARVCWQLDVPTGYASGEVRADPTPALE
jgi:RimJ/RimL family protein N-acetyltransferase